jgi:uncharacterized protein with NRDE domain
MVFDGMCLIVFSTERHPDYPLILGANRDEFYERPTTPARFWNDAPHVVAGRDETAGGTWMGVTRSGAWAAVTNVRDPGSRDPDAPSRGHLVADYLREEPDPQAYLQDLAGRADAYNGFNLLVGSPDGVWYLSNYDDGVRAVEPGLHGLSNRVLDTPWPKVEHAKQKLDDLSLRAEEEMVVGAGAEATAGQDAAREESAPGAPQPGDRPLPESANDPVDAVLDLLDDRERFPDDTLPDTGVGIEKERMLSPIFIESEVYGTRASSVLLIRRDGRVTFAEKTYDHGDPDATRRFSFQI